MEIKNFNFIQDKPILPGDPGYFDFYHKYFSPALKDMVLSDTCPHTIGLFSKWGSGKSSIIDQLSKDIKDVKGTDLFIFDAWKYQEDSLRRTFLIKLEDFLKDKGYEIPDNILASFYRRKTSSVSISKEIIDEKEKGFINFIYRIWEQYKLVIIFLIVPFILGVIFYILGEYYPQNKLITGAKGFFTYVNSLAWLGVITGIFLKPIAEEALKKITAKIFESTKTYTEIRTQVEEEDRLNSPEQFEGIFNEMIKTVKGGKLIIVFDNIDRVQGDVALKILSTIKTFLDPLEKSKVVFLVPCDSDAINKQIAAFYNNQKLEDFDESEYLKKLFNVIIHTPEFIDADLQQYTKGLIKQTGDIKNIIDDEDVVSVITKAFKSDPREVKQFINNLVSAVLVASKTNVADDILSKENIGYFTKVTILKQKFPDAYKELKENWNEPEKIGLMGNDQKLREFLLLTSPIKTDDAEPFIYFKTPEVAKGLVDPKAVRKSLVDGNVEDFERLALGESDKDGLVDYVTLLLKRHRSQPHILAALFKAQLQGFGNIDQKIIKKDYLETSIETIGDIWNNYLELPSNLIFALLQNYTDKDKKTTILDRFVALLSNDEIKSGTNKIYLYNLIDELIKNYNLFSTEQKLKIVEAIRQNMVGRNDILLKFDILEKQQDFVHADIFRNIIQNNLTNENLNEHLPIINLYKEFITNNGLAVLLVQKIPQLISLENVKVPSVVTHKIGFYDELLMLFKDFGKKISEIAPNIQLEIFNGLNNTYGQSNQTDGLRDKVVNAFRWLEILASDVSTKNNTKKSVDTFVAQSSKDILEKVLNYWEPEGKINFLEAHFDAIKSRAIQDDGVLDLSYEMGSDEQKLKLMQHVVTAKPDHGIGFLNKLGDKIPERQKIIEVLLSKVQSLPIEQRVDALNFLKGKIARNDDVNIKQSTIKQIFEYLKSNNQAMVQFGVTLLGEKFLSDTDEREIAKEMIDFYNNRTVLQPYDLPVIEHLSDIGAKLQDALKGKLVYLILSNISSDREHSIQRPLISYILKMNADPELYEKDYSDLMERLLTWADSAQKDLVVREIVEMLKLIPGTKASEYLKKIGHLIKEETSTI